ncbi:hypothetical protein Tco_0528648 [Tanacetum coccineum]
MDPILKLNETDGYLLLDPSAYRTLVGKLLYLIITRPNLYFAAQALSQYSQSPRKVFDFLCYIFFCLSSRFFCIFFLMAVQLPILGSLAVDTYSNELNNQMKVWFFKDVGSEDYFAEYMREYCSLVKVDMEKKENGVTRPKKYSELSATEAIQADCDVKATNIILQGLPPEVYALVSNHQITKELWERIQLFMQGTSLTKQERDVKLEQFQANTKFLNTLPLEWSKFVTDVKLVRDFHTNNINQLHGYLGQHEFHANEVRLMHEHNSDPLALVATH